MEDSLSKETTYGLVKRFRFIESILEEKQPKSVLDVGCGTGNNLTVPLAKRFPQISFTAADTDPTSIEYASKHHALDNLKIRLLDDIADEEKFDLVIASEVIEHVEEPKAFLKSLSEKTTSEGHIILTLPNGFGPFEWGATVQAVMHVTGILPILLKAKRKLQKRCQEPFRGEKTKIDSAHDTLAISPHVNFFSYSAINRLFRSSALSVEKYRPRTFLCGFGFDQSLRSNMTDWNCRVADRLPAPLNSGWMFVLKHDGHEDRYNYRRGPYAKFRRFLNKKQWGVG